ncbi:MAG: hypothetical protein ACXWCY_25180 [Burkholderiales bacterium]
MNIVQCSIVMFVGWLALGGAASAQTRSVIVNGQRVSDAQVAYLEHRACTAIPNGRYWLNLQTGAWGYAGHARVQGVLGDACFRQQRRKSLSERGLLYSPGELLRH